MGLVRKALIATCLVGSYTPLQGDQSSAGGVASCQVPAIRIEAGTRSLADWRVFGPIAESDFVGEDLELRAFQEQMEADDSDRVTLVQGQDRIDLASVCPPANPDKDLYIAVEKAYCEQAGDVYFIFGNEGPLRIKINSKVVYETDKSHDGVRPNYFFKTRIEGGENRITVYCRANNGSAGFLLWPRNSLGETLLECAENSDTLLRKVVIDELGSPELRIRSEGESILCQLEIQEVATGERAFFGTALSMGKVELPNGRLEPGLYSVDLITEKGRHREYFCVGDLAELTDRAAERIRLSELGQRSRLDADAALRRLRRIAEMPAARRKLNDDLFAVNLLKELHGLLSGNAPGDSAGVHLHGFRSKLDGAIRHYRVSVPSSYDPMGILVVFAAMVETPQPFIDSYIVGAYLEATRLEKIARLHGIGIVWAGYRSPPTGGIDDMLHFDEVMQDLGSRYRIDERKVVALGSCSGGIAAGMAVVNWPNRFAGLAYHDAIFNRYINGYRDDMRDGDVVDNVSFYKYRSYNSWLSQTDPGVRIISGESDTPILVLHDGSALPGHGEKRFSERFVQSAKRVGLPIDYQLAQPRFGKAEQWERIFEWMNGLPPRGDNGFGEGRFFARHNDIGPVLRGFAGKFRIVVETDAKGVVTPWAAETAKRLAEAWESSHFASCSVIKDIDCDDDILGDSNLILVGLPDTHRVWSRIDAASGISIGQDGVRVGGREWKGDGLGIQAIITNPWNEDRRIALVGSTAGTMTDFGVLDLAIDGWFDFSVWRFGKEGGTLLDADQYR